MDSFLFNTNERVLPAKISFSICAIGVFLLYSIHFQIQKKVVGEAYVEAVLSDPEEYTSSATHVIENTSLSGQNQSASHHSEWRAPNPDPSDYHAQSRDAVNDIVNTYNETPIHVGAPQVEHLLDRNGMNENIGKKNTTNESDKIAPTSGVEPILAPVQPPKREVRGQNPDRQRPER